MPDKNQKQIITRFAPSPTGLLHIGGVRTALYSFLFANQNNGKFFLRIEDTDKERSKKEYEEDIIESLKWLGLNWDNQDKTYRQSERTEIYKEKIQQLIKSGAAYIAEESSDGSGQNVVRFKNPGGKIKFQDLIRGEIEMDVSDLKDFIIARNINEPIFHFTVVVDDAEMGVTHLIRGEDHISNTPRQILILEALGGERPLYAHLPLVLAPDKSKLSKRKHGEQVSLKYYREKGYLRESIINFLALIGWNGGTDQELFSLENLIGVFDITKVQKKAGVFDIQKLNWLNREYIMKMDKKELDQKIFSIIKSSKWGNSEKLEDQNFLEIFINLLKDKVNVWSDIETSLEVGEYDYLFTEPKYDRELLKWKTQELSSTVESLQNILKILEQKENIENTWKNIFEIAEKQGKGETLWPLRTALSGREKSPDPLTLLKLLGLEEAIKRVNTAIIIANAENFQ